MENKTIPIVVTLGCRLNAYESEALKAHIASAGLQNVVVVNGCAVTGEAERQTRQALRKARKEYPNALIVATGCAAQINQDALVAMPEVDAVIGNADKLKAQTWIDLKNGLGSKFSAFSDESVATFPFVEAFDGLTRGFVPVQTGCDHACTFCIVPQSRGPSRSVSPEAVVAQVRRLVASTYPEIVLTGVDIASYDADGLRLGGLVKKILRETPELKRLRLSSLDPAALDPELFEAFAQEERLMPHMHLSVQSGDDLILKRMKRRHTRKDVETVVAKARSLRPDIAFGADIIAGFPTEDEALFKNTRALLEELEFTWLHVFPYSARKGTPAARMPQVEKETRKERAVLLRALGEQAIKRHLQSLVGRRLELHVEGETLGRAPSFAEVVLKRPHPIGSVVEAVITGVDGLQAHGKT